MSLIKTNSLLKMCVRTNPVLFTAVRHNWNKDFKPAPYPKTSEERIAAAKKYGLHPDEYKPYPDDGSGFGDYPEIPMVSAHQRCNYYPYDYPDYKRNYGEPMHVWFDLITEDRGDLGERYHKPYWRLIAEFLAFVAGGASLILFFGNHKCFHSAGRKQFYNDGRTHYTFESN